MKLTVAILSYNGEALLPACLASLRQQIFPHGSEVLVLDNGSTTPVTLGEGQEGIRLVRLPTNVGNIGGMNACFEHARGDWVLFLANDVRLHPNCVSALWDRALYKGRGMYQPVLWASSGVLDHYGLRWQWPGYGVRERRLPLPDGPAVAVEIVPTTCFLLPKRTYHAMGGFGEALKISHEDVDFGLLLKRYSIPREAVLGANATHLMGQTIGRTLGRPLSPYYRRARRMVINRHYHGWDWVSRSLVVGLVDEVTRMIKREGKIKA